MAYLPLTKTFENTHFCTRLCEFHMSIKDLEILDRFNVLENIHLCTQKSVRATCTRPFSEVGGKSPLQLSSQTHFAKSKDKEDIMKN